MTKKSVWGVSVVALVLLSAFYVIGCSGGTSALVGTWVLEEGQSGSPTRLELSKDGTGAMDALGLTGVAFTWTAEKGHLTGEFMGMKLDYDYKIAGSTLTLTDEKGESAKYKKE